MGICAAAAAVGGGKEKSVEICEEGIEIGLKVGKEEAEGLGVRVAASSLHCKSFNELLGEQ